VLAMRGHYELGEQRPQFWKRRTPLAASTPEERKEGMNFTDLDWYQSYWCKENT
jgi:hypothetical protein